MLSDVQMKLVACKSGADSLVPREPSAEKDWVLLTLRLETKMDKNNNKKLRRMGYHQNTVPSERIIIGGSLVFGRDTSAISLPPCDDRQYIVFLQGL